MWPGQQQPGGEQNPQQPNPYQQPGYQQPNPYQQPAQGQQQPGFGQPGQAPQGQGYQQPGQSGQWGPASMPGGPQAPQTLQTPKSGGGGGGGNKKTVIISLVAAVAVIGAAVAGFLVLGGGDDDKKDESKEKPSPSAEPSTGKKEKKKETEPGGGGGGGGDPKDPSKPQIAGWQTVVNPKWYSAFDVPETKDWSVESSGVITGFEDDKGKVLVAMSAPAYYKDDWCKDSSRAAVGTKGAQGSKDTKEAVKIAASNFVLAGYDQKQKGTLKETAPKPFKNKNGIKGHIASAKVTNAPKEDKCATSSGKATAVSWINTNGDLAIWVLYSDADVKDEVPAAQIKKMLSSLRNYEAPNGGDEPRG
ncbi:hypothetical protein [Streptomyces sp. NPDC048172]|uniref:hypothetical protein n=1 Tax=Streptomyces sp. NPDC048172 TaxID=3365505 RepID=UPI0037164785